jgi:anti-sigma factor RsiW
MSGARNQLHLDDARVQGLADGSLRGPEGLAAREHCSLCPACAAELEVYSALGGALAGLSDPPPPPDFTLQVLRAVDVREVQLEARRQIKLAAIPAALVAAVAVVGWVLSGAPVQRLDELVHGVAILRELYDVLSPVVFAARAPLALAAVVSAAAIGALLHGTLRRGVNQVAR